MQFSVYWTVHSVGGNYSPSGLEFLRQIALLISNALISSVDTMVYKSNVDVPRTSCAGTVQL